jgi:hypothetical protein
MTEFKLLKKILDEDSSNFPAKVPVICGKTLSRTSNWLKAIVLVKAKFGNSERYQIRLYGWQKNKEGVWKQRQKFNISAASYVGDIINAFQVFLQDSVRSGDYKGIVSTLLRKISELEQQRFTIHQEAQKDQIKELEEELKKFENLLKQKRKEKEYQRFLKDNFWMFGPDYVRVRKEEKAGMKGRTDYVLQRFDGYHDIIELKRPDHKLFSGTRLPTFSKDLKNALSQAAKYLAYFSKHYLSHKEETGRDVFLPKVYIVIGRYSARDSELLKIHQNILSRYVEITTYDDILNRAKQTLKTIKKRKSKEKKKSK